MSATQRARRVVGGVLVAAWLVAPIRAQQPRFIPQANTSVIDSSGTAHVTRVVPVPKTVSPAAQQWLARPMPDSADQTPLAQRRAARDASESHFIEATRSTYPTSVSSDTIGGVPVRIVTPSTASSAKRDRVLINIHGGGFVEDGGSMGESIPIASLTGTKVVAVMYRLAPEHVFPDALDDVVAVYRELLKTYRPENIGIYGSSAGAILTAETAVKLRQVGSPLPAALGIFSAAGDFTRRGDSQGMYGLFGLSGPLSGGAPGYVGKTDPHDPVLSPVFADLSGFPPTLFLTSTRDMLLSGTVNLHRAFRKAGVPAELVVFDGLPHAFWLTAKSIPEADEANRMIAGFLDKHVGRAPR